jgi:hypothetical protein
MTVEVDPLRGNAVLVDALGSALRRGGNALGTVPDLLKRVLAEESWREFVTQRGEHVRHERFGDFVVQAPLRGIGASTDLVRRVIKDNPQALDLFDKAMQRPVGRPEIRDNDTNLRDPNLRGTSRDYALRRLRKDAPELHAQVLSGRLTAFAAMVEAGLTKPRFTVVVSSSDAVVRTLRRQLSPDLLAEVAAKLCED